MRGNDEEERVLRTFAKVLEPGNTFVVVPFSDNVPQESGFVTKSRVEAYEEAKIFAENYHTVYIFYVYGSYCAFEVYSDEKHGEILRNIAELGL